MKTLVIVRDDGGVSFCPLANTRDGSPMPAATDPEGFIAKWSARKNFKVVSWSIEEIDPADRARDRTFRDAWKWDRGIKTDMGKAREIHRGRIRAARDPLLKALDIEYQRADERADATEKARIAAKKQALRDATADPRIEAAATPEELKSVWPID